jgi:6-phosphogluconolactonase
LATGPFATGTQPSSITVDESGKFAYVANDVSNDVSAYTIDSTTGALTALVASPFAAGSNPTAVIVDPSGTFVYVANFNGGGTPGGNNISAYTINANTGALTPVTGSPFATGMNPSSVRTDPSGKFLYVTNENPTVNNVSAFTIDASTGALGPVTGSPFSAGHNPMSIAVSR